MPRLLRFSCRAGRVHRQSHARSSQTRCDVDLQTRYCTSLPSGANRCPGFWPQWKSDPFSPDEQVIWAGWGNASRTRWASTGWTRLETQPCTGHAMGDTKVKAAGRKTYRLTSARGSETCFCSVSDVVELLLSQPNVEVNQQVRPPLS